MSSLRVLLALLLAPALAPTAGASLMVCALDHQTCAYEGAYGSGACGAGHAGNYVGAYVATAGRSASVGATTFCAGEPGTYSYQSVAVGYAYADADRYAWGQAMWYGGDGSTSACSASVRHDEGASSGYEDLGCALGDPPAVPALLP